MKRTGFARKALPPRPAKQITYTRRPRAVAVAVADGKARMVVAVPKREYVRHAGLREAYRLIPCQFDGCGAQDGTVCCAHSNAGQHGKGMSIKADDSRGASACHRCHSMLDQGSAWTEAQRKAHWWRAHVRSVLLLVERGLWPLSVPVPDIEHNPWESA